MAAGPGAQIFFRGDDRSGLDPYHLSILPDGRAYFVIEDGSGQVEWVAGRVPLHRWVHLLGALDDRSGQMTLWINGQRADQRKTALRPLKNLDRSHSPGVGIGNVQNDRGPHNQPLHGDLARLEVYDRAVTPTDIGLDIVPWTSEG